MKTSFSELTTNEAITLLTQLGDNPAVIELNNVLKTHPELGNQEIKDLPEGLDLGNTKWRGTEHAFGYIDVDNDGDDFFEIKSALTISSDQRLKGKKINIKLGSLYTMNYPGWGVQRHNVLMHFKCKHANDESDDTTLIEFEQKFRSKEGEGAGNIGDFIFLGLSVPSNGLQFEVQTINISNDGDEAALKVLESESIKNGLDLVNASFATLAPFTEMAKGMLGLILASNRNKTVQQFTLGFDFDESNASDIARIRLGTYVAVQHNKLQMNWNEWIYQRSKGLVVNKNDKSIRLPFNHITFNILPNH